MKEIVFIIFNEPNGSYSAVDARYSLMVVGNSRPQLIKEIRNAVFEYFNDDFSGKIIIREFSDEVIEF